MKYDILHPWKSLDPWQKKYIETEGNCFLLCGRQVGKTAAMSIKFGKIAATKPNQIIMMIALTEKQAYSLFFKTLIYLEMEFPKKIKKGKDKPTKHEINLTNGSKIMCYAAGLTGDGLRGFTLTHLVIDEAAPMSREIFTACLPMLSVTGGTMDISSTPRGKAGFFYDCSNDDTFTKFYVSAENCPRHSKEFLEQEKKRMSKLEYAQEYLAQFLDDLKRIFSDEWIKKVCTLPESETSTTSLPSAGDCFLGVDIARLGEDQTSFEVLQIKPSGHLKQIYHEIAEKELTTWTEDRIKELDKIYNFKKIYIDAGSGSLGVGVFDHLLRDYQTKRKVDAINNRARSLDKDDHSKTKLLKEDLYNNLAALGDRNKLALFLNDDIIQSLKSIQYEYVIKENQPTKLRIFGNYSHVAEGLIRAAWCTKDKSLNIWIRWY